MEEFLQLPWDIPEAKDVKSCFINDTALKIHSSTYKILHDKLQQIFSDDSVSENDDDPENRGKTRNDGNDTLQGRIQVRNKVQIYKKPNMQHRQYIPCFSDEAKLNYPKMSSLNAERQALYLQLMIKYVKKCSFPTQVEEKELQQYELLHDKVVAERFEFAHFVKQRCASTQDRYRLINPDVKKYIEEMWQHRLSQVSKYPAHYEPLRMLSLVYADNKRPVVMNVKESLYEVGSSPVIILPKFKTPVYVFTDYSKMRKRFPPERDITRNEHRVPVSQDKLAESFAVGNAVHVVISSSGLKCIVDNHPPNYEKTWDLPVIVKEYRQCDKIFRVVYVDKALPPRYLTSMEKNLWFHKFGVKSLVCRGRRQECSESERNASSIKDSKFNNNKESCEIEAVDDTGQKLGSVAVEINEIDVESDCSTENCTAAPVKREHSDNKQESDVSTDDENRLVIDCSDVDGRSNKKCTPVTNGRKTISQNNNDENSRVTRSKAKLIAKMVYINKSVGEKPTQFVANEDCEMDSTSSCKDAPEPTDSSGSEKTLEDGMRPSSFDVTENTLCSEVSDSAAVPKGECTRSYGVNISIGNKQDCCVSKHCSAQEMSEEEQTKMKNVKFNLSNPDFNISYQLWKLCKGEGHLEDRKEGVLKGECPNREINVLVRCKVDGHKIENNKKQTFCVVPKMEYLPEYGAQCLTQSELSRQWISLYVRPGADLCRVRVNACTSEVMMIEQHSVQEVAQEAVQVGRPNSFLLGTLYNVLLGLVDLEAGSYLLSHTPKLGAFVKVWQSVVNGRFKLHDMYIIDTKATAGSDSSLWIPIDHNVVTPFHRACNRVPGTFPPTCFVRGKPFSKKKNSSKRHKKKNQNKDPSGARVQQ